MRAGFANFNFTDSIPYTHPLQHTPQDTHTHIYIYMFVCCGVRGGEPFQSCRSGCRLAFTRYCIASKLYCGSQSSFCCPPPLLAKPTLLRYYCTTIAQSTPSHRPPCCMPYTMHSMVIALSCKGQGEQCEAPRGLTHLAFVWLHLSRHNIQRTLRTVSS